MAFERLGWEMNRAAAASVMEPFSATVTIIYDYS